METCRIDTLFTEFRDLYMVLIQSCFMKYYVCKISMLLTKLLSEKPVKFSTLKFSIIMHFVDIYIYFFANICSALGHS